MWSSQRKPTGVMQPQDDRKSARRRIFTRWMNVFLQRREPPLEVSDLFTDIQDGRILMVLLEELSGCKLLYRFRSSSHQIFRLNNISKALAFLDDRHVKLLDIEASSIADGDPSVVLNLVWNIILHFQVKELTGGLQRHLSSSLSSLSTYPSTGDLSPPPNDNYSYNSLPRKGRKSAKESKYQSKAINTLLQWVRSRTSKYGVDVDDFGTSWRSGLAFLALIKSINPDLVDLRESLSREPKENMKLAFMVAHHNLGVPPLLEPKDVLCSCPDEQSIITYVSMFLEHHSAADKDLTSDPNIPEIPNFGSLEAATLGKPLTNDPEALALLRSFEQSNEQLLWRQWSRRFSAATSCHTGRSVSSEPPSSSSPRRVFPPPSPLDACVANQDIRSWVEKGSDRVCRRKQAGESLISLSSEEGIYSLSALDSDEEDAYSYILDLNKEVFQPHNQPKRQVPKVEEETAEKMKEESTHLEEFGLLNGSRYTQDTGHADTDVHLKPEVRSQSAGLTQFDLHKNKSSIRQMTNNRAVSDLELGNRRRTKELEEETAEDDDRKMKAGFHKTPDVKEAHWQNNGEEQGDGKISERQWDVGDRRGAVRTLEKNKDQKKGGREEEETGSQTKINSERIFSDDAARTKSDESSDRREIPILNGSKNKEMIKDQVVKTSDHGPVRRADWKPDVWKHKDLTETDQTGGSNTDNIQDGDGSWTCCKTSQSPSTDRRPSLQSLGTSGNTTQLELEVLLVLWILFYCYLILPEMSL